MAVLNQLLSLGHVPDDWLRAIIVPVFKKGGRTSLQQYCRPVAATLASATRLDNTSCWFLGRIIYTVHTCNIGLPLQMSLCWSYGSAVQKRLNQSRSCSETDSVCPICSSKEPKNHIHKLFGPWPQEVNKISVSVSVCIRWVHPHGKERCTFGDMYDKRAMRLFVKLLLTLITPIFKENEVCTMAFR